MLAICQFLSDGDTISIGTKKTEQVIVSSIPITVTSTRGINEDALSPDYSAREDMLYLQDDEEDGQTEGAETLE
jgi:hypothetical protein